MRRCDFYSVSGLFLMPNDQFGIFVCSLSMFGFVKKKSKNSLVSLLGFSCPAFHSGSFSLSLNNIGFTSEMKIKVRFTSFYFALLSVCIIFK